MPKQRQTCTRCSQRRQKCDRRAPCTRCVQNGEANLCTTIWVNGPVRKYPRKPPAALSWRSMASSSEPTDPSLDASPPGPTPTSCSGQTSQGTPTHHPSPVAAQRPPSPAPVWPAKLPELSIGALLSDKDKPSEQSLSNQNPLQLQSKDFFKNGPNASNFLSPAACSIQLQHIQSMMPARATVLRIVEYYEQNR